MELISFLCCLLIPLLIIFQLNLLVRIEELHKLLAGVGCLDLRIKSNRHLLELLSKTNSLGQVVFFCGFQLLVDQFLEQKLYSIIVVSCLCVHRLLGDESHSFGTEWGVG